MADSRAMWFRVLLLVGLLFAPAAAMAQTWQVCIDPASGGPTPEGFRALRAAVDSASRTRTGYLNYHVQRSRRGTTGDPPPFRIVQLELMRAGTGAGNIRWREDLPDEGLAPGAEHCFEISADEGPPGLWHYWGPYFPAGSAEVPEAQKPNLEYLVVGYQPGVHLFRLEGFADTLGSTEANARLAARRTEAVAHELVRLGVRWDDIVQISIGESLLARPTADGVAEPLNRRVNMTVRTRPPGPSAR